MNGYCNHLILVKPSSLFGRVIAYVTKSPYSHAIVVHKGVMYDSSESRGSFGVSTTDLMSREYVIYEFSGDLTDWLSIMNGTKYDWKGVVGWCFGVNNKDKFYCFEAAWLALNEVGLVKGLPPVRLSGSDLEEVFTLHNRS